MIYLDTTAVAKLITAHPETEPLRAYLNDHSQDRWFTCALTGVELERELPARAAESIHTAIAALDTVNVSDRLLAAATRVRRAATIVDALHIAAAQAAGERLAAFITYDPDRAAAARAAKLPVTQPGLPENR
jgi:predicted nucleic acid-binding protein